MYGVLAVEVLRCRFETYDLKPLRELHSCIAIAPAMSTSQIQQMISHDVTAHWKGMLDNSRLDHT